MYKDIGTPAQHIN